jgi:hypothetical protein
MKTMIAGSAFLICASWSSSSKANLIVNGGFEDGVFTSAIDGGVNEAPVGWTPDAGYDAPGNYNSVTTYNPYDGSHDLFIANDPAFPLASLSQSFTTILGALYAASFEVANVWPTGFLAVMIDGVPQATVAAPSVDLPASGAITFTTTFADGRSTVSTPSSYQQYVLESFDFVGTGSDTLTLAAENAEESYQIDDVAVSLVPEPSAALLGSVGCALLVVVGRRRARPPA